MDLVFHQRLFCHLPDIILSFNTVHFDICVAVAYFKRITTKVLNFSAYFQNNEGSSLAYFICIEIVLGEMGHLFNLQYVAQA